MGNSVHGYEKYKVGSKMDNSEHEYEKYCTYSFYQQRSQGLSWHNGIKNS